jgi:hypothetical protein
MSEPNKSRRQIATFLLLLSAFSAVFYRLILIAHKLEAGRGLMFLASCGVQRYRLAEIKFNWLPTNIIQSGRS